MIEESCGISGAQVWMLREIAEQSGIGITELAQRLAIHQTTCSQLAEKLVARRLIEKRRDADDQRRVGLSITLAGLHVLDGAPHPIEGVLPAAIGALSVRDKSLLSEGLARLITHLAVADQESAGRPLAQLVDVSNVNP
jgi:DNA-binding MarR family transcriptional regulator